MSQSQVTLTKTDIQVVHMYKQGPAHITCSVLIEKR